MHKHSLDTHAYEGLDEDGSGLEAGIEGKEGDQLTLMLSLGEMVKWG
jgi:hypothetical protein